ncbi:MAG: 16S rRNA (cytosine(1402)-N(4))-methyltransferase RsmH [Balneolaceae bacterium]
MMESEMTQYHEHIPVLLDPSVDFLVTDPDGIYVDATLGGGGHTEEILKRLGQNALVYGIDQDIEALEAAKTLVGDDPRFKPLHGNFGYLSTLLPPETHGNISGILFDLGVSTHQLKEPERGFSFQNDGPLDMRMSELSGVSAYQVVNEYSYEKLRDIIFHLGEERLSRQIAKSIIDRRPLETTGELREAVRQVVHGPHTTKSLARVFQAIRIEVNRELDMLKSALTEALELIRVDGRMVAISYHSLEDRIVKTFFRSGNHEGRIKKDFYGHEIKNIEALTKNIVVPSDEEIKKNPAARSARMRAARKIEPEA